MSKFGAFLKFGALAGALALASSAYAATFQVPVNYSVKLVDGQKSDFNYSRFSRELTLSPGRHQIVLLFEGSFGNARDSRFVQAGNPIVIEIPNMADSDNFTFKYNAPTSEQGAELFTRSQKIDLVDAKTNAPLSADKASYYLLTSDSGFVILRDYREDLASVGRLYAPAKVYDEMRSNEARQSVNAAGVQTVMARSANSAYSAGLAAGSTAAAAATVAATSNQAAPTVQASSAGTIYNQLVDMYEAADDATKLQFVKYIMSH